MSEVVYNYNNEFDIIVTRKGAYHLEIYFHRLRNTSEEYEYIIPDGIEVKYLFDNGSTQDVEYVCDSWYDVLDNKPWAIYYHGECILSFELVQVQTLTPRPRITLKENKAQLSDRVEDKLENAVEL